MRRSTAAVRALLVLASVVVLAPATLALASERRFGGRLPWHGVPAPSAWDADRIGQVLAATGVDPVARPETLGPGELAALARRLVDGGWPSAADL